MFLKFSASLVPSFCCPIAGCPGWSSELNHSFGNYDQQQGWLTTVRQARNELYAALLTYRDYSIGSRIQRTIRSCMPCRQSGLRLLMPTIARLNSAALPSLIAWSGAAQANQLRDSLRIFCVTRRYINNRFDRPVPITRSCAEAQPCYRIVELFRACATRFAGKICWRC